MTAELLKTVHPGTLTIIASAFDARPMSYVADGTHLGYEPAVTRAVCDRLGLEPVWHNLPMADFYSSLPSGKYDVIWFNQAITSERQAWARFTRPYGLFDEAVLVRADCGAVAPEDLAGLRVGGLANSTNLELARQFENVEIVPFPGSDQVLPEMLEALRTGAIDALIDDELVLLVAAEEDDRLRLAFSVPTRVPFGVAVHLDQPELADVLSRTLEELIANGTLAQLWSTWIPWKPFPF